MSTSLWFGLATLRRRWRGYVAVAVLLGVLGGLGLGAIAGARRTQSSITDFLAATDTSTLSVSSFGVFDPEIAARIAALPQVVTSASAVFFNVNVLVDGRPDPEQSLEAAGSVDGRGSGLDRFTPTSGRLPDPRRVDEVAFNELAAERYGYRVGQRLALGTYNTGTLSEPTFFTDPPPPDFRTDVTIVGIGVYPDEVLQDEADRTPRLLLTTAFTKEANDLRIYGVQGLVLRGGDADIAAVEREIGGLSEEGQAEFRPLAEDRDQALRALRPLSVALGVFGLVVLLVGVGLGAQALNRLIGLDGADARILRSLGAAPSSLVGGAMVAPTVTVLGGGLLAAGVAAGVSTVMPLGPVRRVASRGVDLDPAVLGAGVLVLLGLLLALALASTVRQLPHRTAQRTPGRSRPSTIVGAAIRAGLRPAPVTGIRMAFEPTPGTARSTPSVILGGVLAVAALIGAMTFGTSLVALQDHPDRYGWTWDATILAGNGYGNLDPTIAADSLGADPDVADWTAAYFGADVADGLPVPLLGIDPGQAVSLPMLEGRSIESAGEVVLGRATAEELGREVGDTIHLDGAGDPHELRIVGIATFPAIGALHAIHTRLGSGALVAHTLVPGHDRNLFGEQVGDQGSHALFVRFEPGADPVAALAKLVDAAQPLQGPGGLVVFPVQRPAEIVNATSIGSAATVLAGLLALGAVGSLGLAMSTTVRRRRRDFAVLKAIGLTRRQLGTAMTWQASATITAILALGVPLGLAVGRSVWRLFADELDVVPTPTTPVLGVVGVVVAVALLANLVAILPALAARRVDVAIALTADGRA